MREFTAQEIYAALEAEFRPWECTEVFDTIGLQYENTENIRKVYTATFASGEVLDELERRGATDCLLFTHHPVPQKENLMKEYPPIPQELVERLAANRITLFTYHIPLDRIGPWSVGVNLAKAIGVNPFEEFYEQNRVRMGLLCDSPYESVSQLADAIAAVLGHPVKIYPYGDDMLTGGRMALMGGGASNPAIYEELRSKGINVFFTGMTTQRVPWIARIHEAAKAAGVTLIGGCHYSTEKFAPMEMVKFFQGLGLEAEFIEETPHLDEM